MADALAALNLPNAVEVQILKLLHQIAQAHTADDLFRASDRAEGFVLGLETVRVLNAASIGAASGARTMIGVGIHEEVLSDLVEQHAVRECLVARIAGDPDWGMSIPWTAAVHSGCRCAKEVSRCASGPA